MTVDLSSPARSELLRIVKRHQKRVAALTIRFQSPLMSQVTSANCEPNNLTATATATSQISATSAAMMTTATDIANTNAPLIFAGSMAMTKPPFQFQLALDALSYLVTQLECERDDSSSSSSSSDAAGINAGAGASTSAGSGTSAATGLTLDDLAKLKTCAQAFLTATYYCLYMATKLSCCSEESCWIGSGLSRTGAGNVRNTFMEQDWVRGRIFYEAHHAFRLGLEDLLSFMKTNPNTIKLVAAFASSLKELKSESDLRVK